MAGLLGKRRVWLAGEKAALVAALLEPGARAADVALQAGVGRTALYRWRKELAADGLPIMSLPAEARQQDHHADFIPVRLAEAEACPHPVSKPASVGQSAAVSKPPSLCPSKPRSPPTPQAGVPPASINVAFGANLNLVIVGVPELALLEHVMTVLSRVATSR